jgi:hypothetical protein
VKSELAEKSASAWMRKQAKEIDPTIDENESIAQCARILSSTIKIPVKCPKCHSDNTWSSNWLDLHGCDVCGVQWGEDENK